MAKAFHIFTVGLAAVVMTSLVACSQGSESNSSAKPDQSSQATTEEGADAADAGAKASSRVVENATLPEPGADPLAMVFKVRQASGDPIDSEQIRVNYPTPEKAVVTTTVTGLKDDSVAALRTRYEFQPAEGSTPEQPLWKVVKVTQQNKCQAGRGAEDWTGDLCS